MISFSNAQLLNVDFYEICHLSSSLCYICNRNVFDLVLEFTPGLSLADFAADL